MALAEPQNTATSVNCAVSEYEWWQEAFETTSARLTEELAADDVRDEFLGADRAPLLQVEADAFVAWREATCDVVEAEARGGTLGGVLKANCLLEMTAEYVLDLSARLIALRRQ
ncbi:lysozyme inhibitor LprI family protein [Aestuariibius sp. 2305UL40-4]|uniref:lysozyme inhibitor LprI family protein n=1 Tax=Aestuariibius violaceus TaxID=3234132 RepID=UPI00345E2614